MNKSRKDGVRKSMELIARFLDQIVPDNRAEAEEELRALGLDPSAVGDRLAALAVKSIRARMIREHSDAVRGRILARPGIDLTDKLN